MKHYEIVFLVHPDQSEQVPSMIDRYGALIKNNGGIVHRCEDWGRKQLAYPINKVYKAHYVLFNIECSVATLREVANSFKFNDAVLRNLILQRKFAITKPSVMLKIRSKNDSNSQVVENKDQVDKIVVDNVENKDQINKIDEIISDNKVDNKDQTDQIIADNKDKGENTDEN